jgi:hypothetical protein
MRLWRFDMFSEFQEMLHFITLAPYLMVGAFLLTFSFVKLMQSELLYNWLEGTVEVRLAKQARKIREKMMADIAAFLAGRREQDLSAPEQKIYFRMIESYCAKIERLYDGLSTENRKGRY